LSEPRQIILVEDNPHDALLLQAALVHIGSRSVVVPIVVWTGFQNEMDVARELQETAGQGAVSGRKLLERLSALRKETAKLFQLERTLHMEQFRDVPALD